MTDAPAKSRRGFASMSKEKRREIASKGGLAVPANKRSFSRDRDLAAAAGKKGGQNVPPMKRAFMDRDLAARAGSIGGNSKGKRGEP